MAGKAKIEKVTMRIPCRVFGCGRPAKYRIGNPQGSPSGYYHLCSDCTDSLLLSISEVIESNNEINVVINEVVEEVIEEDIEEVTDEEIEVNYVWSETVEEPKEEKKQPPKKKVAKKGVKK